jgi:branched-chain amino acid transport system permease protein
MTEPTRSAAKPGEKSGSDHFAAELIGIAALGALLAAAPLAVYPFFLAQALCLALFACAFNLLVGYGGLLSFGHAMFMGSASYFAAHAAKVFGWPSP